jgi:hypothetical protein
MYINWTTDVFINPITLTAGPGPNGIPIPTYGNYGGPDYSDGSVGGIIPTSGGIPTSEALPPVDKLDTSSMTSRIRIPELLNFPQPILL